ncbi:hypothetical protein E2C01_067804 [Portunus trituberculatus]|uniref:Uncharacterized protein n=1 Tax=Portunus trituberculatus TaxID=210409 RepID=A0A5B7HYE1_PORTR|nr:hypothetical protein [Portunus trituberculatus]
MTGGRGQRRVSVGGPKHIGPRHTPLRHPATWPTDNYTSRGTFRNTGMALPCPALPTSPPWCRDIGLVKVCA